jgi:CheY-like chemotaxis protein
MIVSSGKMLLQLVNDVLDLSKMDLGKLEFNLEPSDVVALLREPVPVFQPMMGAKGQTFALEIAEMPVLMVDPLRFRQVLFNFVSNAVKYAGPCTIRISSVYEDGLFKLTVADNGKGVTPEKAKRLMQPFVQADIKNRAEGSGLGLAICKRLIELANGTISIDTAPGKGFAIHVEVPVEVASGVLVNGKDGRTSEVKTADLPKRVLVVDDSPVNRAVLKAMLEKLGVTEIELAEDGRAALETLERDSAFDLVMSDMWMPVMDGGELIKRIRADERLAQLKVCSITADVEARMNYRELGFDVILLKPVTVEKLADLFAMVT